MVQFQTNIRQRRNLCFIHLATCLNIRSRLRYLYLIKWREPPEAVEERKENNLSEEPPAKKYSNDDALEPSQRSHLVVAEAKLVLDPQEGVSVSKDDSTYGLDDPILHLSLVVY